LIPLVYGCHENSNKKCKAGDVKIWAFRSHLRWSVLFLSKNFLLLYQDAGNEAMEFDSVNVCRASEH
ncbi:hypothetical protein T08_8515, partial [Trichinella sp. T8]